MLRNLLLKKIISIHNNHPCVEDIISKLVITFMAFSGAEKRVVFHHCNMVSPPALSSDVDQKFRNFVDLMNKLPDDNAKRMAVQKLRTLYLSHIYSSLLCMDEATRAVFAAEQRLLHADSPDSPIHPHYHADKGYFGFFRNFIDYFVWMSSSSKLSAHFRESSSMILVQDYLKSSPIGDLVSFVENHEVFCSKDGLKALMDEVDSSNSKKRPVEDRFVNRAKREWPTFLERVSHDDHKAAIWYVMDTMTRLVDVIDDWPITDLTAFSHALMQASVEAMNLEQNPLLYSANIALDTGPVYHNLAEKASGIFKYKGASDICRHLQLFPSKMLELTADFILLFGLKRSLKTLPYDKLRPVIKLSCAVLADTNLEVDDEGGGLRLVTMVQKLRRKFGPHLKAFLTELEKATFQAVVINIEKNSKALKQTSSLVSSFFELKAKERRQFLNWLDDRSVGGKRSTKVKALIQAAETLEQNFGKEVLTALIPMISNVIAFGQDKGTNTAENRLKLYDALVLIERHPPLINENLDMVFKRLTGVDCASFFGFGSDKSNRSNVLISNMLSMMLSLPPAIRTPFIENLKLGLAKTHRQDLTAVYRPTSDMPIMERQMPWLLSARSFVFGQQQHRCFRLEQTEECAIYPDPNFHLNLARSMPFVGCQNTSEQVHQLHGVEGTSLLMGILISESDSSAAVDLFYHYVNAESQPKGSKPLDNFFNTFMQFVEQFANNQENLEGVSEKDRVDTMYACVQRCLTADQQIQFFERLEQTLVKKDSSTKGSGGVKDDVNELSARFLNQLLEKATQGDLTDDRIELLLRQQARLLLTRELKLASSSHTLFYVLWRLNGYRSWQTDLTSIIRTFEPVRLAEAIKMMMPPSQGGEPLSMESGKTAFLIVKRIFQSMSEPEQLGQLFGILGEMRLLSRLLLPLKDVLMHKQDARERMLLYISALDFALTHDSEFAETQLSVVPLIVRPRDIADYSSRAYRAFVSNVVDRLMHATKRDVGAGIRLLRHIRDNQLLIDVFIAFWSRMIAEEAKSFDDERQRLETLGMMDHDKSPRPAHDMEVMSLESCDIYGAAIHQLSAHFGEDALAFRSREKGSQIASDWKQGGALKLIQKWVPQVRKLMFKVWLRQLSSETFADLYRRTASPEIHGNSSSSTVSIPGFKDATRLFSVENGRRRAIAKRALKQAS